MMAEAQNVLVGSPPSASTARSDIWRAALLAGPALFYLFVGALPIHGYAATKIETQLLNLRSVCLFFSPAFLPWVITFGRRAWPTGSKAGRTVVIVLAAAAAVATFDAARWAIGMMYQFNGETLVPMPGLR